MNNRQKLRGEAILKVCEDWAFITKDNCYLISRWGLASNLNNSWKAYLFTNKKYCEKCYENYPDGSWAVAGHNTNKLFRGINWTVKRMKGAKIIKQGCKSYPTIFYKIEVRTE